MSLDFKCRDFTKQSDATLFRKENCSSFCGEDGLMWGKWKPQEKAVAVIQLGNDGSLEQLWRVFFFWSYNLAVKLRGVVVNPVWELRLHVSVNVQLGKQKPF